LPDAFAEPELDATRDQLRYARPDILDPDEIGEYVVLLRRLRLIPEVHRPNGDAYAERFPVEKRCG